MGKKKRERKLKQKALKAWEARRPKSFREALPYLPGLFLRTFLVVTAATLVLVLLGALRVGPVGAFWFELLVYLGFYLAFQRFILGPLAPPRA